MNKKQLYILAFGFMLIGVIFIYLDMSGAECLCSSSSDIAEQPLDIYDVYCVINSEMYDPFIWMFHLLWVLFIILAWQTKDKKQQKIN